MGSHGTGSWHERLIAKLQSIASLSGEEAEALRGLPVTITSVNDHDVVAREGDRPSRCCLLVDGFLCRYKAMPHGRRQITSFHVPGDMPDLQGLHLAVMDHSLGALAPSTVAFIPHSALVELVDHHPGIAAALWRETLIDASIFREWIANIGRRTSYQRVSHILCEVFRKTEAVGLVEDGLCPFPLTTADIADATGLSPVEVNRALHKLEGEGLVLLSENQLAIPDMEILRRIGEFDPAYLHLADREAR